MSAKGTTWTPSTETRAKISAARKGQKPSAAARAKMSAALVGNQRTRGKKYGPYSAERRERIGAAQRGRKRGPLTAEHRAKLTGRIGALAWNWKGGRTIATTGYVRVRVTDRYRYEHRVVMERILGRPLARGEQVHHINGIKTDNRPENLELFPNAAAHAAHHARVARLVTSAAAA